MVCLPAVSFTEVPPVHQLELVGGRTHHRSNSVCVRSFYDALPNASARACACVVCAQCHAPHPRIRAHLLSRHRSTGVLKAVTECAAPRAAQPWWREIVGLAESPAQCQRLFPMCVRVRPM